jgi:thymidylate synthase
MNKLDLDYQNLLKDILENGIKKETRNGGTISVFGRTIRYKFKDGKFPLLTTKKMYFKGIVTELLWFLRGDTNIKYLVDNDCHIWDGDAYKNYMNKWAEKLPRIGPCTQEEFINKIKTDDEFAKKWGDLGPIYGKQWRSWTKFEDESKEHNEWYISSESIDQIANLINELKTNPDSRRLMVSAWNPADLPNMVLPPCHYGFQVYTRELSLDERMKILITNGNGWNIIEFNNRGHEYMNEENIPTRAISLMFNMRSCDTFLGLPFNIASYGLLLEIIAKEVNMIPDELIGNLGDVHLYLNHVEQAKEQIGRELTVEERGSLFRKQQNIPDDVGLSGSDRDAHRVFDDFGITKRTREPYPLPTLNIFEPAIGKEISILDNLHIWSPTCFIIENYQSHPTIKAPLSN